MDKNAEILGWLLKAIAAGCLAAQVWMIAAIVAHYIF